MRATPLTLRPSEPARAEERSTAAFCAASGLDLHACVALAGLDCPPLARAFIPKRQVTLRHLRPLPLPQDHAAPGLARLALMDRVRSRSRSAERHRREAEANRDRDRARDKDRERDRERDRDRERGRDRERDRDRADRKHKRSSRSRSRHRDRSRSPSKKESSRADKKPRLDEDGHAGVNGSTAPEPKGASEVKDRVPADAGKRGVSVPAEDEEAPETTAAPAPTAKAKQPLSLEELLKQKKAQMDLESKVRSCSIPRLTRTQHPQPCPSLADAPRYLQPARACCEH